MHKKKLKKELKINIFINFLRLLSNVPMPIFYPYFKNVVSFKNRDIINCKKVNLFFSSENYVLEIEL